MSSTPVYHVLNETGNILIRTTVPPSELLPENVLSDFQQVAAFYAGMTRAMTNTINPITGKPFSVYNYHAVERLMSNALEFKQVGQEELHFHSFRTGDAFGRKLFKRLFGVEFDERVARSFASILGSIGREAIRMIEKGHPDEFKVGHTIFILENLAGISSITAKSIYIDAYRHKKDLKTAPCKNRFFRSTRWHIHTDSYLFSPR